MAEPLTGTTGVYTKTYYTVATLPAAAASQGAKATVTDAAASPWAFHGQVATGGGTIRSDVISDGTNWRLHY